MTQFKRSAAMLLSATAMSLAAFAPAFAETVKLTILGVGDTYNFEGGKARGGIARLNAVVRAERANNPNLVYVFDGDMLSPSLMSGLDKGANMVELTNVMPFDLAVPGNHEFDFGTEAFLQRVEQSKYPWGAVNLTLADGSPVPGLVGTVVKEIGGLKVAIVPVAQDTTPEVSNSGDWVFTPTVATAMDAAHLARSEGADIVIGVVQAPNSYDTAILRSHAFDAFVSGDDHEYATAYDGVTAYVETSTEANYLTALDLTVEVTEKDGKRSVSWTPAFRFIDTATVTPDLETQALVDSYKEKLNAELDVKIGSTAGPLDSRRNIVRGEEAAIGNLIADAMRAANGADIVIVNGGGIRADKEYPAGANLTRKDVLSELPFGNITVITELSGKAVLEALENGFSQMEDGAGRFPQVAGITVTVDATKPAGSRVESVLVGDQPLDPAATYKVATSDFLLKGGDGYTALGTGNVLIGPLEGDIMANDVMDYIAQAGTVDAQVEGRIVIKK